MPSKYVAAFAAVGLAFTISVQAQQPATDSKKPNIVVIWGDDIGMWNIGAYTHGMMGSTPNIDRIAKEGMLFTDHYGQPSCTAGRAAFIMGQLPIRTGMTTVGVPGSKLGIQKEDPTLAEVLKSVGYATAQFGKNHLGDRNEFFPTVHGFDEWFGNLYHLNAEEEPEQLDYPGQKNPEYTKTMGPRGTFHAWATDVDDPTTDPKFGRIGKQRIQSTGMLTRERMQTFDSEVLGETLKWMDKVGHADKPFFLWFNSTAIHIWSHPQKKYVQRAVEEGRAEEDVVRAKMLEHDEYVGQILDKLDQLGVTITPSSSTRPTTATNCCSGRTPAIRHSAARKARPGKAACECRCSSAGPVTSRRGLCPMGCRATRTCTSRSPLPQACLTSRKGSSRGTSWVAS